MSKVELEKMLMAIEPRTKWGRIREVMPAIENRLAAGVRVADILEGLKAAGIELSEGTFRGYVHRHRQAQRRGKAPDAPQRGSGHSTEASPADRDFVRAPPVAQASAAPVSRVESDDEARRPGALQAGAPAAPVSPLPLSATELGKLARPDPVQNAQKAADMERIGMQLWREKQKKPKAVPDGVRDGIPHGIPST